MERNNRERHGLNDSSFRAIDRGQRQHECEEEKVLLGPTETRTRIAGCKIMSAMAYRSKTWADEGQK